jgi:hypothetical protein
VDDLRPTAKRTLSVPVSLGRLADLADVEPGTTVVPLD